MGKAGARILIVDADALVAESLREFLIYEGHAADVAPDSASALTMLDAARREASAGQRPRPFQLVMTELTVPPAPTGLALDGPRDGLELLREIGRRHPATVTVMLTGYASVRTAVDALRAGAVDFLTKPVIDDELRISLQRALKQQALLDENFRLRDRLEARFGLENIIGHDHRMEKTFELVAAVAPSRTTVLMTGESGTGKSLIAKAIHQRSPRRDKAFVEISCGSIPETLLESELFGHVKGAFTGAHADKIGRFLAADGGTIFLDEINSASPGMQLKLLRVLQERRFEPVGSTQTVEVDARVILASNQPLERLVAAGTFRQDLYYRVNVVKIELPPLRERLADVPLLAEHFLTAQARELGRVLTGFSDEAMNALRRYPFPGNVRELSNIVERAAVLCRGQRIELHDLPPHVIAGEDDGLLRALTGSPARGIDHDATPWVPTPLEHALRDPERRILLKALEANHWNRQRTADQLQINRTTLYKKMKLYGIDGPGGEPDSRSNAPAGSKADAA